MGSAYLLQQFSFKINRRQQILSTTISSRMSKTNININALRKKSQEQIYQICQTVHNVISEWPDYGPVSKLSIMNTNFMNEENHV